MVSKAHLISDHIEMCSECGDNLVSCSCSKGGYSKGFNEKAYEDARRRWMKEMEDYNKIYWLKRMFIKKPRMPLEMDFV